MAARTGREWVGGMKKSPPGWAGLLASRGPARGDSAAVTAVEEERSGQQEKEGGGRFRDDREIRDPGCSLEDERIRVEK
ncbi:MAG: hypothetical protein VCA37_02675 [Roseibacillus sp.]